MKRYEYNYGKNPEGALSTISGYATETTNFGETAFGILNKSTRDEENFTTPEVVSSSTATLFSVGNGTDHDSRKNIIELKADGTVYINGVGQYDGTNPGEATSIADEFQGIHDDITGVNEDIDRIDNTIESIHISEDNENLIYTLLVDGQERGTINIPRDQFLKNVSYNEETNNLEFTFIVRGENNEEVEKQINVNMTDLEDIYSAGDGLNLENKQFSVKVDADTQPYIGVSSNGVKIIGINEALDKKVSWDESKKVITLPADGSISALRNNGLEGGVLVCQRTYDEGATYVTEVGTTKNNLTLNSIERPKIDFAGGSSENVAYESEITDISSSLDNYLPLSGGTLTGDVEMENAGLTINHGALTVQDGLNGQVSISSNGMVNMISKSTANVLQIGNGISDAQGWSRPIAIDYNAENPSVIVNLGANTAYDTKLSKTGLEVVSDDSTASYMSSGVTISEKTENDLLNAAGGTTSVDSIKEGLATEDSVDTKLENYLPLTGGTVTGLTEINGVSFSPNKISTSLISIDGNNRVISVGLGAIQIFSSTTASGTPGLIMNGDEIYFSTNGASLDDPGEKYISIGYNGITLKDKSNTDLLNAAGSTTSISDIIAKVPQPDLSPYATKEEVGSNVYTDSNYLSKETNLTDAVLQLDEEIKATNDNLDLEHANAEATYAKKTDLSGYLPKQIPVAMAALYVSGAVSEVSPTPAYSMLNVNGITLLDENYQSRGSDTELFNTNGGTVSIQDIISQVTVPTKVSELINDSGYQTESQVAAKVSALVDSAPETLDTLNELAAALGDDPNFATTVTNQIAQKADKTTATTSADGLMSAADKSKLDSIAIQDGDIVANGFRINNGTANEVLTADGDRNTLKTINGQILLGSGDIDLSSYATTGSLSGYLKVPTTEETGSASVDNYMPILGSLNNNNTFTGGLYFNPNTSSLKVANTADQLNDYVSISNSGINIAGKTNNDLVAAGGGTVNVNTLATQDDLENYVTLSTYQDISGLKKIVTSNATVDNPDTLLQLQYRYTRSDTGKYDYKDAFTFKTNGYQQSLLEIYIGSGTGDVCPTGVKIGLANSFDSVYTHLNHKNLRVHQHNDYQNKEAILDADGLDVSYKHSGSTPPVIRRAKIGREGIYLEGMDTYITISGKTTSDLLNAAGGTTTLKTINGESLLGSGDITTPTPTVNAASGTKTIWTGTQSEYEGVTTKDANTLYFITEG